MTEKEQEPQRFRTLFISDVHLGSKAAKTDYLLDFLRVTEAETIILVGDIVDGWRLKRSWYWPQSCNDVVQKLLRKARKGTRIIYIPGNHDEFMRDFPGVHFGGIEVAQRHMHEAADGRKYLVLHGDEFDVVVRNARLLAYLGDWAYDTAIVINIGLAAIRRRLGMPYWSFSAWAKLQVKHAVNFIGEFQRVVADEARRENADGRHLRPYSSCRDGRHWRHPLYQYRRLGGELHGDRRAPGRNHGTDHLAGAEQRAGYARRHDRGRNHDGAGSFATGGLKLRLAGPVGKTSGWRCFQLA